MIRTVRLWFKQDRALSARVANDLVLAQRFCYNEAVRRVLDDPSTTFFDLNYHLTEMRAKNPWLAEPSAWIQRSAMRQGMTAVHAFRESNFRKHFEEKSRRSGQRSLFRRRGGRRLPALAAFCPPLRREGNALYLPGIGLVLATSKIPDGDIRPFQLVKTTRKITRLTRPDDRTFRLHVQVKEPERSESKSARGIDVGAVHMAATADTGRQDARVWPPRRRAAQERRRHRRAPRQGRPPEGALARLARDHGARACQGPQNQEPPD